MSDPPVRGPTLEAAATRVRRPPEEVERPESRLEEHFENLSKQSHAARLGMWVFLASEVTMFGALFALYAGYRATFPRTFADAAGHTNLWLGSAGTVVLLLASLLVALAVHFIRDDDARAAAAALGGAAAHGIIFLGLKSWEYARHFREGIFPGHYYAFEKLTEPGAPLFFTLYYVMTGLHALHVIGGIGLLGWVAVRAGQRAYGGRYHTPLELAGMYWHFVDIVWLFLWPAFYLMR